MCKCILKDFENASPRLNPVFTNPENVIEILVIVYHSLSPGKFMVVNLVLDIQKVFVFRHRWSILIDTNSSAN